MRRSFTASLAKRTKRLAASNSWSSWLKPSSSRPNACPAMDASPLPIAVPSGPPTNVPSAPPATGSAFLTTPLRTPPTALSDRRAHDLADRAANIANKSAEELIQFLLVVTASSSAAISSSSVSLSTSEPLSPGHADCSPSSVSNSGSYSASGLGMTISATRQTNGHACTSLRSILARSVPDAATRDCGGKPGSGSRECGSWIRRTSPMPSGGEAIFGCVGS